MDILKECWIRGTEIASFDLHENKVTKEIESPRNELSKFSEKTINYTKQAIFFDSSFGQPTQKQLQTSFIDGNHMDENETSVFSSLSSNDRANALNRMKNPSQHQPTDEVSILQDEDSLHQVMNIRGLLIRLNQTENALADERERMKVANSMLKAQTNRIKQLQEECFDLSTEIQAKHQTIKDLHVRLETVEIQVRASHREIDMARSNVSIMQQTIAQLSNENQETVILQDKYSKAMAMQSLMKEENAILLQTIDEHVIVIRNLKDELEENSKELAVLKLQLDQQSSRHHESVVELTRQLEDAVTTISDLQAQMFDTNARATRETNRLRDQNNGFRKNIEELYFCLQEETSKVKLLEEEITLMIATQEESKRVLEQSHNKICLQNTIEIDELRSNSTKSQAKLYHCTEELKIILHELKDFEDGYLDVTKHLLLSFERINRSTQLNDTLNMKLQSSFETIVKSKLAFIIDKLQSRSNDNFSFNILKERLTGQWVQGVESCLDDQSKSLLLLLDPIVDTLIETLLRCFDSIVSDISSKNHQLLQEQSSYSIREATLLKQLDANTHEVEQFQLEKAMQIEEVTESLKQAHIEKQQEMMSVFEASEQAARSEVIVLEERLQKLGTVLASVSRSVDQNLALHLLQRQTLKRAIEQAARKESQKVSEIRRQSFAIKKQLSMLKNNLSMLKSDITSGRAALTGIAWRMIAGVQAFAAVSLQSEDLKRQMSTSQENIHKSMMDQMNKMNELMSLERKAADALLVSRLNNVEASNSNMMKVYEKSHAELFSLRQQLDASHKQNAELSLRLNQMLDTNNMLEKELKQTRSQAADCEESCRKISCRMRRAHEDLNHIKMERSLLRQDIFEYERNYRLIDEFVRRIELVLQELCFTLASRKILRDERADSVIKLFICSQNLQARTLEVSMLQETNTRLEKSLQEYCTCLRKREEEIKGLLFKLKASESFSVISLHNLERRLMNILGEKKPRVY